MDVLETTICATGQSPPNALLRHACTFCDTSTDQYIAEVVTALMTGGPAVTIPDCLMTQVRATATLVFLCEQYCDDPAGREHIESITEQFEQLLPGTLDLERIFALEDNVIPRSADMIAVLPFGLTAAFSGRTLMKVVALFSLLFGVQLNMFGWSTELLWPWGSPSHPIVIEPHANVGILARESEVQRFPAVVIPIADRPEPEPQPSEPAVRRPRGKPIVVTAQLDPLVTMLHEKPWLQDDPHAFIAIAPRCLRSQRELDRVVIGWERSAVEPIDAQAARSGQIGWYVVRDRIGISFGDDRPDEFRVTLPISCLSDRVHCKANSCERRPPADASPTPPDALRSTATSGAVARHGLVDEQHTRRALAGARVPDSAMPKPAAAEPP
jgi:hypothetical protein